MLVPLVTRQTLSTPSRLVLGPLVYLNGFMGRHNPIVFAYGGICRMKNNAVKVAWIVADWVHPSSVTLA